MAHVAWTLTDNSTGSPVVFSFPINPSEFNPPGRSASITEQSTVASSGGVILFQGRDKVREGSMSGVVRDETFKTNLQAEAEKWYPLVLADDLGNTWDILITDISWTRNRNASTQWKHSYDIKFLVIS